jgi:hypothetical protein
METKSTPDAAAYPPPLDRLLELGGKDVLRREAWPDYTAMGFTREHVPELLRMSADPELNEADSDEPRVYAPLHAWRVLGQLRVAEAAAPLADVLRTYDDDLTKQDVPRVLAMLGEPALVPAQALLADASVAPFTRIAAAAALHQCAVDHPELRDRVVSMLVEQLRLWPDQDDSLNGFLIDYLVELQVVEAAPLMQAAFEAGLADPDIRGDWEDVQIDLGLLEKRRTAPRPPQWLTALSAPRTPAPPREISPGEKARKLRKAQKQAARKRKR